MANKRTLKKTINYIAGEIFTECVVLKSFIPEVNVEKTNDIMTKVLYMQDEFLRRTNHPEPGNVKGYYKKLREDFNKQLHALIEEIGTLH